MYCGHTPTDPALRFAWKGAPFTPLYIISLSTNVFFFPGRIFLFVFSLFLACAVLYVFVSPQLGKWAVPFFVLIFLNNLVKQSEPVHVEEFSTWFMIRQLIEAKCLIKQGGSLVFVHGRNHTTFDGLVNIAETEQTSPQYPAGNIFKTEPVGFT